MVLSLRTLFLALQEPSVLVNFSVLEFIQLSKPRLPFSIIHIQQATSAARNITLFADMYGYLRKVSDAYPQVQSTPSHHHQSTHQPYSPPLPSSPSPSLLTSPHNPPQLRPLPLQPPHIRPRNHIPTLNILLHTTTQTRLLFFGQGRSWSGNAVGKAVFVYFGN